ncbi:hypothetical protein SYJ56_21205 [Algoriphagus sp. D3-2-R+10]|uniref:hypothetical protein n=1 Tax=Algoriphagus aurantiacus TaxID=3103948 RepID=UPI002B385C30|nr:hypothetical protein [Algoriphagus sp. D3-2-R+10]MEB2777846.1 hypothetical protein [Algoriphagus sp. D3-2-R+10]
MTLLEGEIREFKGLTQISVIANQLNFRTISLLISPILIAAGLIPILLEESIYFLFGIPLTILIELLILKGINAEIQEAISKFQKQLIKVEEESQQSSKPM